MINFSEYTKINIGKQILISTVTGKVNGTLNGSKLGEDGEIVALVVQQYLHRITVPTEEILSIRLT